MTGYNIYVNNIYQYHASIIVRLLALKNIYIIKSEINEINDDIYYNKYNSIKNIIEKKYNINIIPNGITTFFKKYCYFNNKKNNFIDIDLTYCLSFTSIESKLELILEKIINVPVNPNEPKFISWCIRHLFCREASIEEINYHLNNNKDKDLLTWLFLLNYSEEMNHEEIFKNNPQDNKKIGIILYGHTRNLDAVYKTHRTLIYHPNFDIFIHTWDDVGIKSKDLWYKSWFKSIDIPSLSKNDIKIHYHCNDVIIESNKEILKDMSYIGKIEPIFLFESQARDDASRYINSQLYSVYKAHILVSEYEKLYNFTYDGIIKLRFDMFIKDIDLYGILNDINKECVYFPDPDCNNHGHFGGGGGCLTCNTEENNKLHIKHTNDLCDIWFYGNRELMRYACNLYLYTFDILKKNHNRNIEIIDTLPNLKELPFIYLKGNVIEKEIVCFYPERMLREHLENYHCKSSRNIKGKIFDSSC